MSSMNVTYPYCQGTVTITQTDDYAPEFHECPKCDQTFIVERGVSKAKVMKEKDAPCMSNPRCREIETSGAEEE